MTPKRWKDDFNAIGIIPSSGKYSIGTFAHPDIAFEFASWLNTEFKLYLITEFERLKQNESYQNKIEWSVRRELTKTNYRIHTDSIKENIVPTLTENQKQYVYANEADILNVEMINQGIVQNISGYIQKSKWTWYAPPMKSDRVTYVVYLLEGSIDY